MAACAAVGGSYLLPVKLVSQSVSQIRLAEQATIVRQLNRKRPTHDESSGHVCGTLKSIELMECRRASTVNIIQRHPTANDLRLLPFKLQTRTEKPAHKLI